MTTWKLKLCIQISRKVLFCFYFFISILPSVKIKMNNYLFYMFSFFLIYLGGTQLYIEYLFRLHTQLCHCLLYFYQVHKFILFERNPRAKADLSVSFSDFPLLLCLEASEYLFVNFSLAQQRF